MMHPFAVPPVVRFVIITDCLQNNLFFRLAEGDYQQYDISLRELERRAQTVYINGAHHTTAKVLFHGTKKDTLSGDSVIDPEGLADLFVPEKEDIG